MTDQIDIAFDFRLDTPKGKDPDAYSPTLRQYHKHLWSKPLPSGQVFELDYAKTRGYLVHQSSLGKFVLSSDTGNSSFKNFRKAAPVRKQLPEEELARFGTKVYSIGNMLMFPGIQIERKWTINQSRGCHKQIGDRLDLTLECIRLHYLYQPNPLGKALQRYADFFELFGDFQGYVDFFLLNDLVTTDYETVKFYLPFSDFNGNSPHPKTVDAFSAYLQEATKFIDARNQRILEFQSGHPD